MADQKRWMKVWTSLLVDMDYLSDDLVGKWTRLGCRTALVGNRGSVTFDSWEHLAHFLRVPSRKEAAEVLRVLPGVVVSDAPIRWPHGADKPPVCDGVAWAQGAGLTDHKVRGWGGYEEWCSRHGAITVTFRNWTHYQEDSTRAERARASRSKRRGEEIRGDQNRTDPPVAPPGGQARAPVALAPAPTPEPVMTSCPECAECIAHLNAVTGRTYHAPGRAEQLVHDRHTERGVAAVKGVIDRKAEAWLKSPRFSKMLRPLTLFDPAYFDSYVNEPDGVRRDEQLPSMADILGGRQA
jgi:uncharacterized phage protein (TIGR02220 family)